MFRHTGTTPNNRVTHGADVTARYAARIERAELCYWRTSIGEEVDFVIETGGKLLTIE